LTPEEAITKSPEELETKIEKMSKSKNNGVIAWDTNLLKTFVKDTHNYLLIR